MTEQNPLQEAQQKFIDALDFRTLPAETITIDQALGRTLYSAVTAPLDSPPYPRSIVEGYVIDAAASQGASEDNPVSFDIIAHINPGDSECPTPNGSQAVEVATGSVVPADGVAIARMWEVEVDGNTVSIKRPFPPGFFIEEQGYDIKKGSEILPAGQRLRAQDIGTLASLGLNEVEVTAQPRVAIFASGDEVIPHTEAFRIGAIFDCNTPMLSAAVAEQGGIAVAKGIQSDNFGSFVAMLKETLQSVDMAVISGGTAVGGRDFISDLLMEVGELIIDGVPMKSGRPLIMGKAGKKPIVCVAGHPPEAMRGFKLFGVAALDRMKGSANPLPEDG